MYVRKSVLESSVHSVVHHFLSPWADSIGYKLQPAGPGYESVWGTTVVVPYIKSLTEAGTLKAGYDAIIAHDSFLAGDLLSYLKGRTMFNRGLRIVGSAKEGASRMPTISFVITE